jgi:hypothetical protein
MKIKILLIIIVCMPFFTRAQITLTAQLPNSGILLKEQLWNLVIINNGNDIAELKLQVDVTDILMGQSVINASTGKIMIGKGMKSITVKDVQPVIYNYVATGFFGNYLPCGSYTVNYRLIQETNKGDVPVADEVVKLNVTPLSPPLLATPADKSSIETMYPQFSWMPPAPMQMFDPLLYDILVVTVDEGQTAKEAIEYNTPAYSNTNLLNASEKMPTSFGQLQPGKTYAWQVSARSGNDCAAASEIWTFSIGKDSVAKIIDQAPYIKISRSNTEVTVVHQGVIKMEYFNSGNDKKVTFSIYNAADKAKSNRKNIEFDLVLANGQNFLMYDIAKKTKLDEKTVYEVSMINGRGEEWLMRFIPVYYRK